MTRHKRHPDIPWYVDGRPEREWVTQASCRNCDPELFFPNRDRRDEALPLLICSECPVIGECLTDALATDSRYGIWGGLTEGQRSKITGKRKYG